MLTLGSLGFAAPLALFGLLALPVIYWLLRVTPPAPHRVRFPAIRLLRNLGAEEETPAHTPLWLMILRLGAAALLVLAFADPLLNPGGREAGSGPLLIAVDNGWAAAANWERRADTLDALISNAERNARSVALLTTAPQARPQPIAPMSAADAAARIDTLQPQPFAADRAGAARRLTEAALPNPGDWQVVWLSDGIATEGATALAEAFGRFGSVEVIADPLNEAALALRPPHQVGQTFEASIVRAGGGPARSGTVRALGAKGRVLAEEPFTFKSGETVAAAALTMPLELRNEVARIEITGAASAGAVALLDDRWQRRTVGLVSGGGNDAQPLLSDLYYLRRAISPFAELREPKGDDDTSEVGALLDRPLSMLVLADVGQLVGKDEARVREWVEGGGTLVRFAGPRLAAKADELTPVRLRGGGRALGGALTWATPQGLAPFPEESPFAGLEIPKDVEIRRQVLAEPASGTDSRTWARLTDGTPLVSAAPRGEGWVVLFHVSANTEWSNLPISGLYVEMLRRLLNLSRGTAGADSTETTLLSPFAALDGRGALGALPPLAEPLSRREIDTATPGPTHPPGLYGQPDSFRALNVIRPDATLEPLTTAFADNVGVYAASAETRLKPLLLVLAALLLLADGIAALVLSGRLAMPRGFARLRGGATAAAFVVALAALAQPDTARAQAADETPLPGDDAALLATLNTRLAYVVTGDPRVDDMSRSGLSGLSQVLRMRTAVEPADPMGVNVETDELAFYPLLYWPVLPNQKPLSPAALARVDTYMKRGGTILFDTRDHQNVNAIGTSPANQALRDLLGELDIPPLEPVPEGHVLTKAFYLLQTFPGRWAGGQLWVEAGGGDDGGEGAANQDGVSPILIGSNDYAAAWALDAAGRPLAQPVPGGERQRETAQRFGVNLVMYTLTGNYKADQVHVPALLERLGQ